VNSLRELFESLARPSHGTAGAAFAVVPIADDTSQLMGKDRSGFPALLVQSDADGAVLSRVELQHLSIDPNVHCEVTMPDGQHWVGSYTLIRCRGDDELQEMFFRLVSGLLNWRGSTPTQANLAQSLMKLVDLFRALTAPPRKSLQGLWAELLLIASACDPVRLLDAWHADPTELYDFNDESHRIEVKSCSGRVRVHTFRLDQLYPPPGSLCVIVSTVAQRAGGGTTVEELVDEISEACAKRPDLQVKLRTIVTETIGAEWRSAARTRFDRNEAAATRAMFMCDRVPRIQMSKIPAGISHVRFDLSLEDTASMEDAEAESLGGLIMAALERD
jgi:hypothetical protein